MAALPWSAGIPGLRMREAREPSAIPIPIIVQDPSKTPDPVNVTVRGPLLAGPIGERMAVFDYNVDRDVIFAPATPRKDGSFPEYELDDLRFHQLNTYAIAARATELVELELGRPLRWGFEGSRLLVVPHAGILENAFYSAESHSLQFYSFMGNGRRRRAYHTALAHDIVAHETGHAILDAVRPRYHEPFEPETSAVHEAVGDLCAVFAALSHEVIQRRVAGSLHRLNLLSEIAEGFEEAGAHGWGAIRSLVDATPSDWKDTIEPHDLSLKLSSTIYLALRTLHQSLMRRGQSRLSALHTARTVIQRMAVRALDFLPPADCTIAEYAEALLAADRSVHPADHSGYRAVVHGVLARRGLVSKRVEGLDESRWLAYPHSWPRPSVRDAYLFLNAWERSLRAMLPASIPDSDTGIGRVFRNNFGAKGDKIRRQMADILKEIGVPASRTFKIHGDLNLKQALPPGLKKLDIEVFGPEKNSKRYLQPLEHARRVRGIALSAANGRVKGTREDPFDGVRAVRFTKSPLAGLADMARLRRQLQSGGLDVLAAVDTTRNNTSIVMRLTHGSAQLLLVGDAEEMSCEIMRKNGTSLQADVIKVGHHGSINASPDWSFTTVMPTKLAGNAAVISTDDDRFTGENEVPTDTVLKGWRRRLKRPSRLLRTDSKNLGESVAVTLEG